MNLETKALIESIISRFKETDGGLLYNQEFTSLFDNNQNQRISIGRIIIDDLKLIDRVGDHGYRLNMKGWEFKSFEEIEKLEKAKQEKEILELELAKSNIEANTLNREIAIQNRKNERHNRKATYINILIGLLNISLLFWQIFNK